MTFTPAQAFGKYTILSSNLIASVVMLLVAFYFYYRSKKSPLLLAYLSILGLLLLWTVSKVLKTVTPNVPLRWLCVVVQYFGVQFLGFAILLFALLYAGHPLPGKKKMAALLVHPIISFLLVVTNPWHMQFYRVFTYERTRFGLFFLPSQIILYLYIVAGMILLVRRSFEPSFHRKKRVISRLFSMLAIVPLFVNFYYITFKFTDIPWIFPFRPFDVTPIAMALSMTLFAIPAIKYNFLDIVPLSYRHLYQHIDQGIIVVDDQQQILDMNWLAEETFPWLHPAMHLSALPDHLFGESAPHHQTALTAFITQPPENQPSLVTPWQQSVYKWRMASLAAGSQVLSFIDIREMTQLQQSLEASREMLDSIHQELMALMEKEKALAMFRARAAVSQNVHDIVGHSLTVVMGTLELALLEESPAGVDEKLHQARELLLNSLSDLHHSLAGSTSADIPNLVEAIMSLESSALSLDVNCHGNPYPLNPLQNEAVYRLCQEAVTNAVKHGQASTLHLFLRYHPEELEIYAIDNGRGCPVIEESVGLSGMRTRLARLGGQVTFGAAPGSGFHIHASIPVKEAVPVNPRMSAAQL
ncbi:sensor histidine kinase [Anoxynatronum buryatiense]|uniref:histidine kinase n=1 Tax=Anoxynatronum buryatiense TaxID=489973 RepID=A0AA46AJ19_9CLOT|nr:histidine kinase N-terminal 7TM domain-containing protein [Anoxynatronum buryatiense]SMP55316.1 Signal transduction histidine kinase [Anoxynatronum buryatiense]